MATFPVKQLTKMQRLMGCINLFRRHGDKSWLKWGPSASVDFEPNITTQPVYTNEFGDRRLLRNITTLKEGTVNINELSAFTDLTYAATFVAEQKYLEQAAVANGTLIIEDAVVPGIYQIPGFNGAVTGISDGADVDFIENTHFTFHSATNLIEVLSKPVGADADLAIAYTLPEITAADGILNLEVMSASGTRGEFMCIGMIADSDNGVPMTLYLPDVEFRPSGAISAGDTENVNTVGLTGSVYTTADKGYGTLTGQRKIVNA